MVDSMKRFSFDLQLFADAEGNLNESNASTQSTNADNDVNTENSFVDSQGSNSDSKTLLSGNNGTADVDTGEQGGQSKTQEVPDKYDFTSVWGEGAEVDEQMLNTVTTQFKNMGLSNEQASELVKLGVQYGQSIVERHNQTQLNHFEQLASEAREELGKDFNPTVTTAAQGVELMEREVPGLRDWLDESGLGNDVRLIKIFAKIGNLTKEDTGHLGKGGSVTGGDPLRTRWKNSPEMFK